MLGHFLDAFACKVALNSLRSIDNCRSEKFCGTFPLADRTDRLSLTTPSGRILGMRVLPFRTLGKRRTAAPGRQPSGAQVKRTSQLRKRELIFDTLPGLP
jgi:hypothetical protein